MKRAAEWDWAEAQVELARMNLHGLLYPSWARPMMGLIKGVPNLDYQQSLHWLRLAAQQGDARGKYFLSQAYIGGDAVAQDHDLAMDILEEVAEQGLEMAQLNLALYLWTGELGPRDKQAAKRWFQKGSAKAGSHSDPEVALLLADAFAKGWCVNPDPVQECYWTAVALRENSGLRKGQIKRLLKAMDPAQVERAKKLISSDSGLESSGAMV